MVRMCPEAVEEYAGLPERERDAIENALRKLTAVGTRLGHPHTSDVRGAAPGLRELRPRGGRSSWRVLYARVGEAFVVLAVGPEAQRDPQGFRRSVAAAEARLRDAQAEDRP